MADDTKRAEEQLLADAGELHLLLANVLLVQERLRAIAAARGEHGFKPHQFPLHYAVAGMERAAIALAVLTGGLDKSPLEALSKVFADAAVTENADIEQKIAERQAAGAAKH